MNELIKITEQNGKQAVSARELHSFLESKQDFSNWIKNRIKKYGLTKNQDYEVFDNFMENPLGGRPLIEYALSIDCAKELAMVEGNAKGKQARKYFIECEKNLKEVSTPQFQIPQTLSDALLLAGELAQKVESQTPKVEYYDNVLQSASLITTNTIAKELGMSAIALNKKLNELKVIYKEGGSWFLFSKYQDKGYTGTKTFQHEDKTHIHLYWTQKGRQFIHNLF